MHGWKITLVCIIKRLMTCSKTEAKSEQRKTDEEPMEISKRIEDMSVNVGRPGETFHCRRVRQHLKSTLNRFATML